MTKIAHVSNYRHRRSAEYPAVPDQIDAIYKGFVAIRDAKIPGLALPQATLDWLTAVEATKTRLPKST